MSVLMSSEYKPLRKSHSLPHIASRHDSGVSGITTTTTISGSGSCSLLDQIDYHHSTMCNEHNFNNSNHSRYHCYHNHHHLHHNNNISKIKSHHHHQCDNVSNFSAYLSYYRHFFPIRFVFGF